MNIRVVRWIFDISYSKSQVFLENFLSQLAVVPATLISAVMMDKFGRVTLLGRFSFILCNTLFIYSLLISNDNCKW